MERRKLGLENAQALKHKYKCSAACWDRDPRQCCGAARWATQRIAESYRALSDFYEQVAQQMAEDLAAAEARRLPVIAAQPTLRLELPEALQQAPSRLDMCSKCARAVQQVELLEERCRGTADTWRDTFRRRAALAQGAAGAAAASLEARDGAAAAAAVAAPAPPAPPPAAVAPAGEAQQGERPPMQQQQRRQQQHDCGGSGDVGADGPPTTPTQQRQQQQQQQQQHSSSDEEQR
jgi:hypothetical protein